MFFTTSCQAELNTHINCDLAVMTVLWLLSLTILDSCSKTCISLHKLFLKTYFTLILYTVAYSQLFIKDMMDGWINGWMDGWGEGRVHPGRTGHRNLMVQTMFLIVLDLSRNLAIFVLKLYDWCILTHCFVVYDATTSSQSILSLVTFFMEKTFAAGSP